MKMATRIRDRAIRRAGELLQQIEPAKGGDRKSSAYQADGAVSLITRTEAARDAGMSERQQVTAIRVANVPKEDFDRQVDSPNPPTVTAKQAIRPRRTAEDIVEIGRDLIAVQSKIGRGNFLEWVEAEFDMSRSAAYRFINVAERFKGKLPSVGSLDLTALYELAAPSTPNEVVAQVEARAASGETVTVAPAERQHRARRPPG